MVYLLSASKTFHVTTLSVKIVLIRRMPLLEDSGRHAFLVVSVCFYFKNTECPTYYAPEQDQPFNTKHVITTLGHKLSVALFYIHTKLTNTSYNLTALDYITGFCMWKHVLKITACYLNTKVTKSKTVRISYTREY
jgi:hypothetical protein